MDLARRLDGSGLLPVHVCSEKVKKVEDEEEINYVSED